MIKTIDKIEFCDVNFSYDEKLLYDKNITAKLNKGNIYLLNGPNGSGKSTLANILLKVWRDYKGKILINDIDLKSFTRKEISELVGLSFQKTPIFHDTVENNICLGKKGNIERLLLLMGFDEDLKAMNRNLNSWLKDGSSLSGGQAQKIGIMRTIFQEKEAYIFDEPTSNLDQLSKKRFFDLLEKIKKDKIIILISHEEDVLQYIDSVIDIKGEQQCM